MQYIKRSKFKIRENALSIRLSRTLCIMTNLLNNLFILTRQIEIGQSRAV